MNAESNHRPTHSKGRELRLAPPQTHELRVHRLRVHLNLALLFAMICSMVLVAPVAAQTEPLDQPAGLLPNLEAGCASFDDIAANTSFTTGQEISSGKLTLSVGNSSGPGAQAVVEASSAINPTGNELNIIAILIGIVTGAPGAGEVTFSWKVEEGESIFRVNGQSIVVPTLAALDGRTIEGVRVAAGDINGDGIGEFRASGPIQNLAIGGKNLIIDDLCIQVPPQPAGGSRDLGDAPDATNHWGAPMTAYPAVAARFPTVYDPAVLPAGPAHQQARPFHLGATVSREANADWGPDGDGFNNILPPVDAKNRDRYDDGVNPALIPFANCAKPVFPVEVFISPAALANLPDGKGYLNLWVDANRDGDWEDSGQCTPAAGGAPVPASEHFVVDAQIDATALGAGLHTVNISANRAVIWPANLANQPAWLRATLSEAPSVKLPGQPVGDGRGPVPAFRTGETEDYLWRPANDPSNGPDVAINKRGLIIFRPLPGNGQGTAVLSSRVVWLIEYRNVGTRPATNVVITDNLTGAGVTPANALVRSAPSLPSSTSGSNLLFNVGTLQPGRSGRILIAGTLPSDALSPQLTNQVSVAAEGDVDPSNNSAQATAKSVVPAPRIILPGDGTTNRREVVFAGSAWFGEVDLYIDGAKVASPPVVGGRWAYTITLAAGDHNAVAVGRVGAVQSPPSNIMQITVNPSLSWDPLSLRMVSPSGNSQRPTDESGRTDVDGWRMWLEPNVPVTVSAALCNNEVSGALFSFGNQPAVQMLDPDSDRRFGETLQTPGAWTEPLTATISVGCTGPLTATAATEAAAASDATTASPDAVTPRVGGGAADQPGRVRVIDAVTRQPINNARVFGLPELGWVGCLTCTVAAAGAVEPALTDGSGEVLLEDLLRSGNSGDSFTYQKIVWTVVEAPGYQRMVRPLSLNFEEIKVTYRIALLPAVSGAADHVQSISDNDFEGTLTQVQLGDVVRLQNLSTVPRILDKSSPKLIESSLSVAATSEPDFSTGVLEPGESVDFVASEAGTLVITDANDPSVQSTIEVVELAASPVYLPLVNR
jgi:hypothetical protein